MNEVITLVNRVAAVDAYGDLSFTETERTIFAEVASVGQSEFYQAEAVGLRPEIKFIIADYLDYNNEQIIKYTPFGGTENCYSVIRTYRNGTRLEITCHRGVNS